MIGSESIQDVVVLRDKIALAMLQELVRSNPSYHVDAVETHSKAAYAYADAMIEQREKEYYWTSVKST